MECDCSEENPCLAWMALWLRNEKSVLKLPDVPTMNSSLATPCFAVSYAGRLSDKCPSEYLNSDVWVRTVQCSVKGVNFGSVDNGMVEKAKLLVLTMQQRLDLHISDLTRVHKSRRHHYTLDLVRVNAPEMAATMCLSDHVADDLKIFKVGECLLAHPNDHDGLRSLANEPAGSKLSSLEGS